MLHIVEEWNIYFLPEIEGTQTRTEEQKWHATIFASDQL